MPILRSKTGTVRNLLRQGSNKSLKIETNVFAVAFMVPDIEFDINVSAERVWIFLDGLKTKGETE